MEAAIPIVLVVALVEFLLSGLWTPFYFRMGIVVFKEAFPCRPRDGRPIDPDALSTAFAGRLVRSIVFHAIGPQEIAFRERFIELTLFYYTPVMRGHIQFDDQLGRVTVSGYANAFPLCFLAMAVGFCLANPVAGHFEVGFLIAAVVVIGVCYVIQVGRFENVCKELRKRLHAYPRSRTH